MGGPPGPEETLIEVTLGGHPEKVGLSEEGLGIGVLASAVPAMNGR